MKLGFRALIAAICYLAMATRAPAHEVRPAYLELRQTGVETYDALWKVPGKGELRLGLEVDMPSSCTPIGSTRRAMVDNAYSERWSVRCAGGLNGGAIHISGLSATMIDVLVRVERLDGNTQVARLTPAAPSFIVESSPSRTKVARTYLVLGVDHILRGADHLLFVFALLILVKGGRRLFWTVTAFTAAHSLSLAGATLGFVRVPAAPVEATIALSIMFVALEIVRSRRGDAGVTTSFPWLAAFAFGLLHGFGFAGALSEVGLPPSAIPTALLFFNVGVELGQLAFIAAVALLFGLAKRAGRKARMPKPAWAWLVPPYLIGGVSAFWFIQRLTTF